MNFADSGMMKNLLTDGGFEFTEKPENPETSLIATGFYMFKKEDLLRINEYINAGNNPDAPGYYINWLYKKTSVFAYVFKEPWYDIGEPVTYKKVNEIYKNSEK